MRIRLTLKLPCIKSIGNITKAPPFQRKVGDVVALSMVARICHHPPFHSTLPQNTPLSPKPLHSPLKHSTLPQSTPLSPNYSTPLSPKPLHSPKILHSPPYRFSTEKEYCVLSMLQIFHSTFECVHYYIFFVINKFL